MSLVDLICSLYLFIYRRWSKTAMNGGSIDFSHFSYSHQSLVHSFSKIKQKWTKRETRIMSILQSIYLHPYGKRRRIRDIRQQSHYVNVLIEPSKKCRVPCNLLVQSMHYHVLCRICRTVAAASDSPPVSSFRNQQQRCQ